jgi:hypothetical protein
MNPLESNDIIVEDGGEIYPFCKNGLPVDFATSSVEYTTINLFEFTSRRNIKNATLDSLTAYLPDGAIIAGGFMTSVFSPEHTASDIDIFFLSGESFLKTYDMLCNPSDVAEAWAWRGYKTATSRGELLANSDELRTVTFTNEDPTKLPIQLIKMVWFSAPEDVIDSFDFTVCQFSATREHLIFNPVSWVDLHNKELIAHRWQIPVEMLYRLIKYVKKGFKASPRTLINACESIRSAKEIQSEIVNVAKYV